MRQVVNGRIPGSQGIYDAGENEYITRPDPGEGIFPVGILGPPKTPSSELQIVSVEFLSDHSSLRNHDADWENGGDFFDKPEWPIKAGDPTGHPVSHTMDKFVELKVIVEFTAPRFKSTISGILRGVDAANGLKFEKHFDFTPGKNEVDVTSDSKLPKKVQRLKLNIHWMFLGKNIATGSVSGLKGVSSIKQVTRNEIYVTMEEPMDATGFSGITLKRMKHAVEKVSSLNSLDPHTIVRGLMNAFPNFTLGENPLNAWILAEPGQRGDCRTIVRYVINLLSMVGCPGDAKCVLVYEKLRSTVTTKAYNGFVNKQQLDRVPQYVDFDIVAEEPVAGQMLGGLDRPELIHPNEPWKAILFDRNDHQNAFEACLQFNDGVDEVFYGGGAGEYPTKEAVIGIFKSLSWAIRDEAAGIMKPMDDIFRYS